MPGGTPFDAPEGVTGPVRHRPWPPPPCVLVRPAAPCAERSLNEHRLRETPVVNGLLGHLPGAVPFSTHLELENARSRPIGRASADSPEEPSRPAEPETWKLYGCREGVRAASTTETDAGAGSISRANAKTLYVQRVTRWPLGGMIDLLV